MNDSIEPNLMSEDISQSTGNTVFSVSLSRSWEY